MDDWLIQSALFDEDPIGGGSDFISFKDFVRGIDE